MHIGSAPQKIAVNPRHPDDSALHLGETGTLAQVDQDPTFQGCLEWWILGSGRKGPIGRVFVYCRLGDSTSAVFPPVFSHLDLIAKNAP